MAKYRVKFEVEVIVDMPDISVGSEPGDVVYTETRIDSLVSDDEFNDIVSEALNVMEDMENCVTEITLEEPEEE